MLYIDTASYTGCGGHEINEDTFCCAADFFAVADGLGGHINGEEASRCAIGYLIKNAHGDYSENNVKKLLEGANSAVFRQAKGAKTTIAVLFAEGGVFRYANVGDSRVYIFRNDRLLAMTKDHSVCRAAVDMGTMEFDEIRRSEDRSKLLKVLGNEDKLNVPKGYPPIQMQDGDAFLICSDGFWDYVLESEMEADLLKSDSPKKWLNYMLKRHIAAAMNKGDNYTAICGMVRSEQDLHASGIPNKLPVALLSTVLIITALIAAFVMNNTARLNKSNEENTAVSDSSETEEETEADPDSSETAEETEADYDSSETAGENEAVSDSSETAEETEADPDSSETAEETEADPDSSETAEETEADPDSSETAEENEADYDSSETAGETEADPDSSKTAEENEADPDSSETTAETTAYSENIHDFIISAVSKL